MVLLVMEIFDPQKERTMFFGRSMHAETYNKEYNFRFVYIQNDNMVYLPIIFII